MKNTADPASDEQPSFSVSMDEDQTNVLWDLCRRRMESPRNYEASEEERSLWEGTEIQVQWDEKKFGRYRLNPLERPNADIMRFRQPIASAYQATLQPGGRGDPRETFVIKLPLLEGLEHRIEHVSLAYQQEYNLRDRFPPGDPKVLPELMPDHRTAPMWESTHPYLVFAGENAPPKLRRIPCVIREYIDGKSLGAWAREQSTEDAGTGTREFRGLEHSEVWYAVAYALLRALSELHRERATHGFLYPENIILRREAFAGEKVVFDDNIVFTNAAESHRSVYMEEKSLKPETRDFPIRRLYDSLENRYIFAGKDSRSWVRFDLDEGSDYYSATDIFSLGVTLAYLAAGNVEAMSPFDYVEKWEGGWQIIRGTQQRRKYHVMKAKVMDSLLAAAAKRATPDVPAALEPQQQNKIKIYEDSLRRAEIILQCLRSRADRRALSANHALTVLQMFRPPSTRPPEIQPAAASDIGEWNDNELKRLIELARDVKDQPEMLLPFVSRLLEHEALRPTADQQRRPAHEAVRHLVSHRMRSVLERITALDLGNNPKRGPRNGGLGNPQPFLRVVGSRITLVDAFLTAISSLGKGDELIALTTPSIWYDDNFGPTSRISSMLQLLRLQGVTMRWLILVSRNDLFKPQTQRVLGFRCADDRKIQELWQGSSGKEESTTRSGGSAYAQAETGFFYACLAPAEYERVLREKKTFIGFRKMMSQESVAEGTAPGKENSLELHIAPDLSSRAGTLVALTFWLHPRRGERLMEAFKSNLRFGQPVINFERSQ